MQCDCQDESRPLYAQVTFRGLVVLVEWLWVGGLVLHMQFGLENTQSAKVSGYKKQVLLFLVVFLLTR